MNKPKVIVFLNAYTEKKSGGVMVALEVARHSPITNLTIITSKMGQAFCQQEKVRAHYLITTSETQINHLIFLYLRRATRALFINLKLQPADILLAASDFLPNVLPIWFKKVFKPRVVWVQHIFHLIPKDRKISFWAQGWSLNLIKNWANLIIVDNQLLKKELVNRGFSASKIIVNHLGVDHQAFSQTKSSKVQYQGVFLGRLHPSKGIFDLIAIWQLVVKEISQAKLIIIGHGQEEMVKKLTKMINQKGLRKNIILAGYLNNRQVQETLRQSQIFVFPSHEEGFGLAPLEAQVCQKPIVVWNLPVFDEVFPQGAIKIPFGRQQKFANQVIKLIKDRQFYQEISQQARENSLNYSWEKTAQREWQAIKKIVN